MSEGAARWARACLALDLLARDPGGLRGMVIRARSGPVRDAFLDLLGILPAPILKLHPAMPRDALLGGVDLSMTLTEGRLVRAKGLLETPGTWVLSMAERCQPDIAAILAARLDAMPDAALILLDEGAEPDEAAPQALAERLAFHVDLDGIGRLETGPCEPPDFDPDLPGNSIETLTSLAARLGIHSLRAPSLALAAARALGGPDAVQTAAELVYAHRATQLPQMEGEARPDRCDAPPEPQEPSQSKGQDIPDEILVDAIRALLPPDVLEKQAAKAQRSAKGSGAGQRKKGNRRGRPLPSRPGRLGGTARLDLVATLRAAAPWQKMRGRGSGPIKVLPQDIHLKRFEEQSDRLVIFAVDASGSAAMTRMAEAKGAVELMLARAYAARDHVALIAFRGTEADLLLPPTRSLVQTKRRLSALPGGGGTPLALGLKMAGELAQQSRAQGLSPMLALLTDGRANITLEGTASRAQAGADATKMGGWLRASDVPSVVLDLGTRPQPHLAELSKQMGGTYLPLPRADAARMSAALEGAMADGHGQ